VFYLDIPYVCNDFQTFLGVFLQVFQKHVSVSLCFFQVFQKHASVPDLEDLVKAEGTSDYDYTAIAIVCSTAHEVSQADKHRVERESHVGYRAYLKLQPYCRQKSVGVAIGNFHTSSLGRS
jgi:hypothetical protein